MLILLFDEEAAAPTDETTGAPVTHCQDRLRHVVNQHARTKGSRIIIPAPALGEFLVRTKPATAEEYIAQIRRIRGCEIAPFAERAAIEFAEMQRLFLAEKPRRKLVDQTHAKAKFDQQIVAIAKSRNAQTIYSDDRGLKAYAARFKIDTIGIAALPLSPESRQGVLALEAPEPPSEPAADEAD